MKHLGLILVPILALSLVACAGPSTAESPTAAPTVAPTHTPRPSPPAEPTAPPTVNAPSVTPAPTTAPTALQLQIATLTAELSATVVADLPPTLTPDPNGGGLFPGIDGVSAQPLSVPGGWQPLWVVASHGMSMGDPSQRHFVAIYARDGEGWAELDRAELANDDYLDPGGLTQVEVDPRYIWLEAQGGTGAHSGCYDLLRFDGQQLSNEASSCSSSPGAGGLEDLNNDGVPEVVLDATDHYVFCYACGVRLVDYTVLRWDGQQMVEVALTPIPAEKHLGQLAKLTNQAIELAEHGLWKDAQATLDQTVMLAAYDKTAAWDAAVIRLVAEARAEQAASGAYPLLDHLFYGDYAAALDVLRPLSPAELFGTGSPLVQGTVAEGFEAQLTYAMTQSAGLALELQPDLAAAHFLRGWAVQQTDPGNPSVLADIERAAELKPDEALFSESLLYLKR